MHKIKVGLFDEDCKVDVIETWVHPRPETTVEYDGTKGYKAVLLNYDDQSFVKLVLDPHSVEFFKLNLFKVTDVMTRALIWRSFFDMVKDAKLTADKYLDIFRNNIDQEPFDSLFEKQFDLAHAAINSYTPKKYR